MMVLCSRLRKSNIRTLPSAPQLTNTSTVFAQNRTSKTSLSCAINCVFAVSVGMSQIVQVVSILDVMMRLGEIVFQSREVIGAVCSGDLEFDSSAKGDSFAGWMAWLTGRVIELLCIVCAAGNDHRRKWSPEVANKSVVCFWDDGGSQRIRVTGYECVASAVFVYSSLISPLAASGVSGFGCVQWVSTICICYISQRPKTRKAQRQVM